MSHCSLASRTVLRSPAVVTFAIGESADVILARSCAAFGAPFGISSQDHAWWFVRKTFRDLQPDTYGFWRCGLDCNDSRRSAAAPVPSF